MFLASFWQPQLFSQPANAPSQEVKLRTSPAMLACSGHFINFGDPRTFVNQGRQGGAVLRLKKRVRAARLWLSFDSVGGYLVRYEIHRGSGFRPRCLNLGRIWSTKNRWRNLKIAASAHFSLSTGKGEEDTQSH